MSGGYTSVFLEKNLNIQLYAKLLFSYALWSLDPTVYYDSNRVTSEYKMMELFYNINPEAVAVPYLYLDIDDDMTLLEMQWSEPLNSDEPTSSLMTLSMPGKQLCIQFHNCIVVLFLHHFELKIASTAICCNIIIQKLAQDLAKLHCIACNPNFNIGVRNCVICFPRFDGMHQRDAQPTDSSDGKASKVCARIMTGNL